MVLTSLLFLYPRVQGVVVFLVFVIIVVVVANVNSFFRSEISRLLGNIRLLGRVNLIGAFIHIGRLHIGRLPWQDSKFLAYVGYFSFFLFIGHIHT